MLARFVVLALVLVGCSDDSEESGPIGGSITVTGDVVDFQTRAAVSGSVSLSTSGISPAPKISAEGAAYTITDIPENSVFQILAATPATHRPTFSQLIEVTTSDLADVDVPVVLGTYLDSIAAAFTVTPTASRGVLFARLVDAAGMPKAGVTASNLVFAGGADLQGPFFLDANMMPAIGAQMSTASGWAVFFEVAPGIVTVAQTAGATVTLDMPTSPVAAGAVTIADVTVIDGMPPVLPTNISFREAILPIFKDRGCVACHSGNGAGRNLGNLKLDMGPNPTYAEVTATPLRVQLAEPEKSLMLTKPLYESPPNHQNGTFATTQDPDYIKMLVWIREGAKNN